MQRRFWRLILSAVGLPLLSVILSPYGQVVAAPLQQSDAPIILAAGDVANCGNWEDEATAQIVERYPGAPVLVVGDGAEDAGLLQEFNECYGPTWGRFKDRTYPVPGNREYGSGNPIGYFTYWGDRATPLEPGCTNECKGYYSFDVGDWHIVALNSEQPYDAGSDQEQWLRADLAANPRQCTLAYFHRPYFSSGRQPGSGQAIFQALYEYGADLFLSGHDHHYERFAPQSPSGALEPERGVRQFIVGTGGHRHRSLAFIQPNSEARDTEVFGVLKLTLHPDRYDWELIPIEGQTFFSDSGSAPCVSAGEVPAAPPVTTQPVVNVAEPTMSTPTTTTTTATTTTTTTPATTSTTTVPPAGMDYTVVAGDTVSLIAARYGLVWQDVASANGLTEPYIIEIGQVLRLPGVAANATPVTSTPPATTTTTTTTATTSTATTTTTQPATTTAAAPTTGGSGRTHTVASGETIIAIAAQYGVDWRQVLQLNGLTETSIIQVGQTIRLP